MKADIEQHRRNYAIYKRRVAVKKALFAAIWLLMGVALRTIWLMRFGY